MGYTYRKLKVVIWKCLVMRRHHLFRTLLEIVIPICLFGIMFFLLAKGHFSPETHPAQIVPSLDDDRAILFMKEIRPVIKYCPKTPDVEKVMEQFKKELNKVKIYGGDTSIDGYNSEQDMMEQLQNLTSSLIPTFGIIIEDISKKDAKFKYRLRLNNRFDTGYLFPEAATPGPSREYYGNYLRIFVPLQLLLDRAFTKVVTSNVEQNWKVSFQPFPYPAYSTSPLYDVIFSKVFPIVTAISFLFLFPLILLKVVEEKLSGVKELQQMMGLPSWMIWFGFLFNSLCTAAISMLLILGLLATSGAASKLFPHSDFSLLFVLMILYVINCIFYCFLVASMFLRPTLSVIVGLVLWVSLLIVLPQNITAASSGTIRLLATYFPGYAMTCAFTLFGSFEANGIGMTWRHIFSNGGNASVVPMALLFLNMIISSVVMGVFTWYFENVHPGPYGLPKPYLFFLKKSYWTKATRKPKARSVTDHANYTAGFEPPPPNSKVGVRVRDLTKNFGNFVAVDNLSIDFYEGQITALLGHNGAGKTTTMSILTGMFPPSSGEVTVQNYDIFKHMDQFRDSLGLCPQHNLLFTYLSVMQHLIFFGMIKGLSRKQAKVEGLDLLRKLNMTEKKNQPVSNLSGGMKRKLQLAIALIGGPKILMLDEPTSGMDPESRREMWDLLLSMRGNRTIIITTHFMEEADVLGDRIAIMDHGQVKCYGTTLFLKKIYGAGYQLTFLTTDEMDVNAITKVIQSHVLDATLHNTQSSQITYAIPSQDSSSFPELFAALEQQKASLKISSISIACTTIEEVFLKVGEIASKEKATAIETANNSNLEVTNSVGHASNKEPLLHRKVEGLALLILRFKTLLKKRSISFKRTWMSNVLQSASFISVLTFLMFYCRVNEDPSTNPTLVFSPDLYPESKYFLQKSSDGKMADTLYSNYEHLISSSQFKPIPGAHNLSAELLKMGMDNEQFYRTSLIAGAVISNTDTNLLFNTIPLHALPISLNMYSNALLKSVTGLKDAAITTSNHPINFKAVDMCETSDLLTPSLYISTAFWALMLLLTMPTFFSMFFNFPVEERINNCKQLQLMTGTSWMTYWSSLFVFDFFVMSVVFVVAILCLTLVDLFKFHLIAYLTQICVLTLLLFVFGCANLLFTYSFSLLVDSKNSITYYYVLCIVFAPISIILSLLNDFYKGYYLIIYYMNQFLACFIPLPSFVSGITHFLLMALSRSKCGLCPNNQAIQTKCKDFEDKTFLRFPTKEDHNMVSLGYPMGSDFLYLLISILVHMGVITFVELQINGKIAKFLVDKFYNDKKRSFDYADWPKSSKSEKDPDVLKEKDRIDGLMQAEGRDTGIHLSEEISAPIFIVQNLKKTFFSLKRKFKIIPVPNTFKAVRGVSFAVSPGECFGLLGVNGAGKTTTFRMLTGDTVLTNGDATLFGYSLKNKSKYLSGIGYCPQFNGINEKLTAQEMLVCFSELRGVPRASLKPIIDHWIKLLGLEEYRYRVCGKYSGGNKRKLSTAMALIGDPPLVFLDEPTSGVDPISRHNLWAVLSQIQKTGQCIVLTSHSMDECEALCNRLTIMVHGEMQCLGNITYLKQRYGQGFTLMIKLRMDNPEQIAELKEEISNSFDGRIEIKDEHKGLIHYQILEVNYSWSTLFSKLESIKLSFENVVEDYSLSDTSLEQIFIAFAKGKGQRREDTIV